MIAIPAIDLRGGACVQLVGGDYGAERVRLPDPVAVAERWRDRGLGTLHVVDLDAATGAGDNAGVVDRVLAVPGARVRVGGGLRSTERIAAVLDRGATVAVAGTRAVQDPAWLAAVAGAYPGRIAAAADARGREVLVRGWTAGARRDVLDVIRELDGLPLAGFLVTAVHAEGRLAGPDLALIRSVAAATRLPVTASGGIASLDDLRRIAAAGAAAAVIGMALYTGVLDPDAVAREFGS